MSELLEERSRVSFSPVVFDDLATKLLRSHHNYCDSMLKEEKEEQPKNCSRATRRLLTFELVLVTLSAQDACFAWIAGTKVRVRLFAGELLYKSCHLKPLWKFLQMNFEKNKMEIIISNLGSATKMDDFCSLFEKLNLYEKSKHLASNLSLLKLKLRNVDPSE